MRTLSSGVLGLGLGLLFVGCTSLLGDFTTTGAEIAGDAATVHPAINDGASSVAADTGADSHSVACDTDGTCACDASCMTVAASCQGMADGTRCTGGACCGGTCASCAIPANASPVCNATACTVTCNATYEACTTAGAMACVDPMTDPSNCGACGQQCGSAGCSGGFCQPTTVHSGSPLGTVKSLACDGTLVYWVNSVGTATDATVYQVPLSGGNPIKLSPDNPTGPAVNVAVSGTTVAYAIDWGGEQVQLFAATEGAANSGAELLVLFYGAQPVAMANQGTTFYAAVNATGTTYDIAQTTLSSSSASTVVSNQSGQPGATMATAANAVFWSDVMNGVVGFYTTADPNMMTGNVSSGETGAQSLTTDGAYLYWVVGPASNPALRKAAAHPAPQTASTVTPVSGQSWMGVQMVASNGTNIYWADKVNGVSGIYTVPVGGGTPQLRAPALSQSAAAFPSNLAICGTSLVWFEAEAGAADGGAATDAGIGGVIRSAALP